MEKYRNSSASLNTTYPLTNNRFFNTGPLYTMSGSTNLQRQGPQLLMNTTSVGTSTQFQFVPARHQSTNNFTGSSFHFGPIINSVKTFFSNLLKPKVEAIDTTIRGLSDLSSEKRKCNSAPNIYMDIMSERKCVSDFDKSSFVDVADYEMLTKLSLSTKSFSDYNLPVSTVKSCSPSQKVPEKKVDVNSSSFEETKSSPHTTKETSLEKLMSPSSVPVPLLQSKSKTNCSVSMPTVPIIKSWRHGCPDRKRRSKDKISRKSKQKSGKNKKDKDRQELALKIHEDCETENETVSTDEWDEPLVIITAATKTSPSSVEPSPGNIDSKLVSFSADDFPAISHCNSTSKQTWELPRLSHCFAALNGKRQRQISECDSEDSFIVFDNEDKFTPSSVESNQSICDRIKSRLSMSGRQRQSSESSDDDFICFEMEESDAENDCDDEDVHFDHETVTSDSDCESEVDIKSSGTNPPDSGFEDKKVRFNLKPVVHVLRTWSFAYHQARKGEWEQNGRDRVRFHDRIKRLESTLVPILDSDHRRKVYCDRFLKHATNDICNSAIDN